MQWVNVRQLKNNPSVALRDAVNGPVLVMKGDKPEAVLVHLEPDTIPDGDEARRALALCLFDGGGLSLGRSARVAGMDVASFITYLSRRGVSIVHSESADQEASLASLDEWLASS